MEKLNELVELVKKFNSAETRQDAVVINAKFNNLATRETIIAIDEAFKALEQSKQAAEHERDCHMDIAEHFKAQCKELGVQLAQYVERFEAEAERADRNHEKLAELEKQEPYGYVHNLVNPPLGSGVAASIFKKENRHYGRPVFTRPAPAINLAELVPDAKAIRKEAGGYAPVYSLQEQQLFIDGATWLRSAILRNIEEAK